MRAIEFNSIDQFNAWDFEKLKWVEIFRNGFVNFSIDVYDIGVTTPMMYKNRPPGSNKIIIPFEGRLRITTETESAVFDPQRDGLCLIIIGEQERRQFENIGDVPAKVLAIYAPPFSMEEIDHIHREGEGNVL